MQRPVDVAKDHLELPPVERCRFGDEVASRAALEDPELVPLAGGARPADVGVSIPPAGARINRDVSDCIDDIQAGDEVESSWLSFWLQPRQEDDQVARVGATEAKRAARTAAVVAVGGLCGKKVWIEVYGAIVPGLRCVADQAVDILETEHRRPPRNFFRYRQQRERAVIEQRRASGMSRVDTNVGEEHGHVAMLTGASKALGRMP